MKKLISTALVLLIFICSSAACYAGQLPSMAEKLPSWEIDQTLVRTSHPPLFQQTSFNREDGKVFKPFDNLVFSYKIAGIMPDDEVILEIGRIPTYYRMRTPRSQLEVAQTEFFDLKPFGYWPVTVFVVRDLNDGKGKVVVAKHQINVLFR
jgi:hypothetical protein